MRVLVTTDTVGGVWTYTRELTEGLLEQSLQHENGTDRRHAQQRPGHPERSEGSAFPPPIADVSISLVSFGRPPSAEQQSWADSLQAAYPAHFRFTAHALPLEWMQHNQDCYETTAPLLLEQIARFSPDLLHLNQFCYGALPVSIPKLIVAHSDVLSWHSAVHGRDPEPSRWLETYQQLVQTGLDGADAIIAPTRSMLHALQQGFCTSAPTYVIPNARTLAPLPPLKRKLQAVTIGRLWDPGKNAAMLAQVTSPVPLLLAGETDLEESQFASYLTMLGALTERALQALLAESAIYIATSLYEPFGLAPLEAALSGCALVLHDIPSLREVWEDTALYFRDAAELSTVLTTLANDQALTETFAARAGERAQALYTRDTMVGRYLALYAELANGKRSEGRHVA